MGIQEIDDENAYWWSLTKQRVEQGPGEPNSERLGPYRTRQEAEHALERAKQRNEEWEAQDAGWE